MIHDELKICMEWWWWWEWRMMIHCMFLFQWILIIEDCHSIVHIHSLAMVMMIRHFPMWWPMSIESQWIDFLHHFSSQSSIETHQYEPFTFNVIPIVICNVVVDITCNDPFTIVGDTSTSISSFSLMINDDDLLNSLWSLSMISMCHSHIWRMVVVVGMMTLMMMMDSLSMTSHSIIHYHICFFYRTMDGELDWDVDETRDGATHGQLRRPEHWV